MLENFPYFWNKKTQIVFFHFEQLWICNYLGFLIEKIWRSISLDNFNKHKSIISEECTHFLMLVVTLECDNKHLKMARQANLIFRLSSCLYRRWRMFT